MKRTHHLILPWKKRVSQKKRAATLEWIRRMYPKATDDGERVTIPSVGKDMKPIWIFLLFSVWRTIDNESD